MCIVLFSTAHPRYPFILLSNRDEFLNRSTASAHRWEVPNQHVFGGRDLEREEHGTWLGVTQQGRIAALTNFREEGAEKVRAKSRGAIINAYLTSSPERHESPKEFATRLINDVGVHDAGGFSMLFGELKAPRHGTFPGLNVLSNRSASAESLTHIATKTGETHGLSNSHFGDRSWPKVTNGEQLLKQAIATNHNVRESEQDFIERLFGVLSVDDLPKRKMHEAWDIYVRQMRNSILIPPTHGPSVDSKSGDQIAAANETVTVDAGNVNGSVELEPKQAQIDANEYGTQKQSVILVGNDGKVTFLERTRYAGDGRPLEGREGEVRLDFSIDKWDE